MENVWSFISLLLVYPLLIVLFHHGKYPSQLVSIGNTKRQCAETAVIFGVILVVRWLKKLYPAVFVWAVYTIVYLVAGLCLLFVMEKAVISRSLSSVGFKFPSNRKVLMIFAGVLVVQLTGGVLRHLILNISFSYLNIYFISGVVVGPFVEETVFRGLIQTRLEAGFGTVRSWVLSGTLFGFYHYWAHFLIEEEMLTFPFIAQLVSITFFGMLLGVTFAKTRSLLPPFLLHAVNNFVATG